MTTPNSPNTGPQKSLPLRLSRAARHRIFLFCCNNTQNLRTELAKTAVDRLCRPAPDEKEAGK